MRFNSKEARTIARALEAYVARNIDGVDTVDQARLAATFWAQATVAEREELEHERAVAVARELKL